uniref:Uncharacterized protein n=1 Tax=Canis lupus familiaris TaxID=9615 RepID=A0A8C0TJG0_CANLF
MSPQNKSLDPPFLVPYPFRLPPLFICFLIRGQVVKFCQTELEVFSLLFVFTRTGFCINTQGFCLKLARVGTERSGYIIHLKFLITRLLGFCVQDTRPIRTE